MAKRPVYEAVFDQRCFVRHDVEFRYFNGFADSQKQKSIDSLHRAYCCEKPQAKILEISSKSKEPLGIRLSAFNLMLQDEIIGRYSVESAFQASKVFENG